MDRPPADATRARSRPVPRETRACRRRPAVSCAATRASGSVTATAAVQAKSKSRSRGPWRDTSRSFEELWTRMLATSAQPPQPAASQTSPASPNGDVFVDYRAEPEAGLRDLPALREPLEIARPLAVVVAAEARRARPRCRGRCRGRRRTRAARRSGRPARSARCRRAPCRSRGCLRPPRGPSPRPTASARADTRPRAARSSRPRTRTSSSRERLWYLISVGGGIESRSSGPSGCRPAARHRM